MKTITLTDEQFDNLFNYLDEKVNYIVDKSIDYQDSEILNEWEDLIEVYDIIEDIKVQHEKKLQAARAKQPKAEWQYDRSISVTSAGCLIASSDYNYSITNKFIMIFENTWQGETVLHEAFIDDNADVSIREVTLGGDPIEDFVSYHPNIGASDDELTKICDDIYQTLMGAFVAKMMEVA